MLTLTCITLVVHNVKVENTRLRLPYSISIQITIHTDYWFVVSVACATNSSLGRRLQDRVAARRLTTSRPTDGHHGPVFTSGAGHADVCLSSSSFLMLWPQGEYCYIYHDSDTGITRIVIIIGIFRCLIVQSTFRVVHPRLRGHA